MKDQCTLIKNNQQISDIFASQEFWKCVDFMPYAKEALERLSQIHKVIICSIGTNMNLSRKAKWINERLQFINNCILINNGENFMDKSIINMNGGFLIEDVGSNLFTSNAKYKICYGKTFDWNKDIPEDCIRIPDWLEVENYINMITSKEDFI